MLFMNQVFIVVQQRLRHTVEKSMQQQQAAT